MKLKKISILVWLALASVLLSACSGAGVSTGFLAGTVDQDVLYTSVGNSILAVRPDGSQLWRYPDKVDPQKAFYASPVVTNGMVIVGDFQNSVFALDATNGVEKWSYKDAKGRYIASPILVGNTIIAANGDGYLYALDQSGKLLWKFEAKAGFWGTPVTNKAIIYVGSMDHLLYAINAQDGSKTWSTDLGGPVLAPPLLVNNTLYVGTLGNQMIAVDIADGKILWKYDAKGTIWSAPVLKDNTLYFGDLSNGIYALSTENGTATWTDTVQGPVTASPGLTSSGLIFVSVTGEINAIGFKNEKSWTDKVSNGKLYSTPIVLGERLVLPVDQGDPVLVTYDFTGRKGWTFAAPK